jgi:hypothetical protein
MTATYTFDVFTSLDGFGSHTGDWGGYWGKQGPELLAHRLGLYAEEQRMVFGATTFRTNARLLAGDADSHDAWVTRMRELPATVVSSTLREPLDWPDATVVRGDPVETIARLKETRPAAISVRFSDRLPCERSGTGDSCSRAAPSTATPRSSPTGPSGIADRAHGR